MDQKDFTDTIDSITFYLDIFILVCLLTFESIVFYKLKFKVDKSGILMLLLHLIVSIFRVIRTALGTGS